MKTARLVVSMFLFVAAAALLTFAVWSFVKTAEYAGELMAYWDINFFDEPYLFIDIYMNGVKEVGAGAGGLYAVYAFLLTAGGLLLLKKDAAQQQPLWFESPPANNADSNPDSWFEQAQAASEAQWMPPEQPAAVEEAVEEVSAEESTVAAEAAPEEAVAEEVES